MDDDFDFSEDIVSREKRRRRISRKKRERRNKKEKSKGEKIVKRPRKKKWEVEDDE